MENKGIYKDFRLSKGYPAFNAMICWEGYCQISPVNGKAISLYARTKKELKCKIDNFYKEHGLAE